MAQELQNFKEHIYDPTLHDIFGVCDVVSKICINHLHESKTGCDCDVTLEDISSMTSLSESQELLLPIYLVILVIQVAFIVIHA
jgi:hypothetical protein